MRGRSSVPLAVTGGFRTADGIERALADGATDFIGLARPLASEPGWPARVLRGESVESAVRPVKTGVKFFDERAIPELSFYEAQLRRIADGEAPLTSTSGAKALWEMTKYALKTAGTRRRA